MSRARSTTEGRAARAVALAARALDGLALALAAGWLGAWTLGAWAWPLPAALHLWGLAGPALFAGAVLRVRRGRGRWAVLHLVLYLVLLAGWTAQHAPALVREPPATPQGALVLATLNAGSDRTPPRVLARWACALEADVLFLQELSAAQARALADACAEAWPFRELHGLGLRGAGVLSRHPLADVRLLDLADGSKALLGRLELDGVAVPFAVVHLSGWVSVLGPWGDADAALARVLAELGPAGPALVAGDLNATAESPLLAPLRRAGFADAFARAGTGLGLTFPEFLRYRGLPLPPLVRIDHVLVRGLEPVAARLASVGGADHRAVLAAVEPPAP